MLRVLDLFSGIGAYALGVERAEMSDTLPNEVREAICAEIEEALCGISVGEDADGMSYGLIDAIADARHETDLKGAGDILRDASADIFDAALSALETAPIMRCGTSGAWARHGRATE